MHVPQRRTKTTAINCTMAMTKALLVSSASGEGSNKAAHAETECRQIRSSTMILERRRQQRQRRRRKNGPIFQFCILFAVVVFFRSSGEAAMVPTRGRARTWLLLSSSKTHQQQNEPPTTTTTAATSSSTVDLQRTELKSLQEQAAQLRQEANDLQMALQQAKLEKAQMEQDKVDQWIDDLLIEGRFGGGGGGRGENGTDEDEQAATTTTTELLKTVDQVLERLREDRYSAEQVNKIFRRLCELRPQEARSNISPMMGLLVDAAGKLDCEERDSNPNKRWNGRVERLLRKKLFARDWRIELEDEDELDAENPWKVR